MGECRPETRSDRGHERRIRLPVRAGHVLGRQRAGRVVAIRTFRNGIRQSGLERDERLRRLDSEEFTIERRRRALREGDRPVGDRQAFGLAGVLEIVRVKQRVEARLGVRLRVGALSTQPEHGVALR